MFDLNSLKLIRQRCVDPMCCQGSVDCERPIHVFTYPGFDGYVEACSEHAREELATAVDENDWQIIDGKLVERTDNRCRDCGVLGETVGHQTCAYPQEHL
jgi:hypothetical protein